MKELLLIIVSSALVNNVVLSQFMGLCPFLGVSKTTDTAAGMGGAVIFVITLSSFVTSVIYKLILQPLVENALLHGIDIKRQTGKIWISGNVSEGKLILIVKDNGRGMTKEQIRDLFNSHAKKTNGLSAVGIPNVKERLELYYGTQGGMEYVSSGNGTEVTVFLPAIYDMPEEGRKN